MCAWKGGIGTVKKIIIINVFGFSRSVDYGTTGGPGNRRIEGGDPSQTDFVGCRKQAYGANNVFKSYAGTAAFRSIIAGFTRA